MRNSKRIVLRRNHHTVNYFHGAYWVRGEIDVMLFLVCNQTVHFVTFLAIQILCVRIADVRYEAVHVGALRYLNGLVVGHEVLWLGGIVLTATLASFCWSFIKN